MDIVFRNAYGVRHSYTEQDAKREAKQEAKQHGLKLDMYYVLIQESGRCSLNVHMRQKDGCIAISTIAI